MIGGAAATISLAGCIGSASGNEFTGAADPWSNSSDTELTNGIEQTGFVTLPSNQYAHLSFSSPIEFTLTFKADAGSPLDYYLLEQSEFDRYREQKEFSIFTRAYAEGKTTPSFSATMGPGDYEFVFDNTVMGPTQPNGEVKSGYRLKRVV